MREESLVSLRGTFCCCCKGRWAGTIVVGEEPSAAAVQRFMERLDKGEREE